MKCELKTSTIKKGEEIVTDYLKPALPEAKKKQLYIASKHKKITFYNHSTMTAQY